MRKDKSAFTSPESSELSSMASSDDEEDDGSSYRLILGQGSCFRKCWFVMVAVLVGVPGSSKQ